MHPWKAILSYDGTSFHGWQIQPHSPTIQGTLAQALFRLTGERVIPQGSGRTDAGVHALGQVASFSLSAPIPATNLHKALNRMLPASIRILSVEAAAPEFHARHSACWKTYEYRVFQTLGLPGGTNSLADRANPSICSPMLAPYAWSCPFALDTKALQSAASFVLGSHDFTSFAAVDPDRSGAAKRTCNQRTIFTSAWINAGDLLLYRITGSGFLHHMVRNLVGTFIEIGRGRLPATSIPSILAARRRETAGPTAPAQGLFLVSVGYELREPE